MGLRICYRDITLTTSAAATHGVERLTSSTKAHRIFAAGSLICYAAFLFAALTFAHLARCAAAIFLRADDDMVRLTRFDVIETTFRALAHLARCAFAILRRESADTIRVGRSPLRDIPLPFKDSIIEIAWSNFPTRNCARLCSSRSC